jgi:glycosyltransferase involved in cell wall biosynthesis
MTRRYNKKITDRKRTFFHFAEGVYFAKLIQEDSTIRHIHAHYVSHPATVTMIASVLNRIPFSFTAHATDIWEDKLFIKEKVNGAKFAITCSEYGRRAILNLRGIKEPKKITTVYHGVDTESFRRTKPLARNSKPIILNIGRLFFHKAQDNLIKACKILRDQGVEFQCLIGGDGPLKEYLEKLINDNMLQENIKMLGAVLQEDIKQYYEIADIFVLPSISENLPNVLLESLSMGIPVIATEVAGIPELIKDKETGILVKPNDIEGLAKAMELLICDENLRKNISEKGKDWVTKKFDAARCLERLEDVYRSNNIILDLG